MKLQNYKTGCDWIVLKSDAAICCWEACQISEQSENNKPISYSFEISQDLVVQDLTV